MVELALYELGHSIAGLADEYEYGATPITSSHPNLDTNGVLPKWRVWIPEGVPLPSAPFEGHEFSTPRFVGAFEGGGYTSTGVFRPSHTCRMRELGQDFCAVCKEAHVIALSRRISFVNRAPSANRSSRLRGNSRRLTIPALPLADLSFAWGVCGRKIMESKEPFLRVSRRMMGRRNNCVVELTASLNSELVRSEVIEQHFDWTIVR